MEAVRAFNNELSSIYEGRPPVSRAKMAAVTKSAIKAVKFYKHVVQSIEKFISKCKPEYKIPGLYVIDSVVRQSRHQFGRDKDVFAARFSKNIVNTFLYLFKCPPDDKSKIIRVLNLWQKNDVFPSEIIQVLLDLAEDPSNTDLSNAAQSCVDQIVGGGKSQDKGQIKMAADTSVTSVDIPAAQNEMLNTVNQLLQQMKEPQTANQQQQHSQQLQLLQQQLVRQTQLMQQNSNQESLINSNLLSQIEALTKQLLNKPMADPGTPEQSQPVHSSKLDVQQPVQSQQPLQEQPPLGFKKLLEFDYGESDDDEEKKDEMQENVLPIGFAQMHKSPIPEQLRAAHNEQMSKWGVHGANYMRTEFPPQHHHPEISQRLQPQPEYIRPPLPPQPLMSINTGPPPNVVLPDSLSHPTRPKFISGAEAPRPMEQPPYPEHVGEHLVSHHGDRGINQAMDGIHGGDGHDQRYDEKAESFRHSDMDTSRNHDDRRRRDHSRRSHDRRSRSRSRSPRRRHRSRSRNRHKRSHDYDSRHRRSRSKERDERDRRRERERERKRKCLPPLRDSHISVCTTTVWLGHVSKTTTESEIRKELEQYGAVEAIHMVPPRGCAFVCMSERKNAARAIEKLKGIKINGSAIKTAWAPGRGVKETEVQSQWVVDDGVSYVHWDKMPRDLSVFLDGGIIDDDSLPEHLRGTIFKKQTAVTEEDAVPAASEQQSVPVCDSSGLPLPPPIPPPQPSPLQSMPTMIAPGQPPPHFAPSMRGIVPMIASPMRLMHQQIVIPMSGQLAAQRIISPQVAAVTSSVMQSNLLLRPTQAMMSMPMRPVVTGPTLPGQMPTAAPPAFNHPSFEMQRIPFVAPGLNAAMVTQQSQNINFIQPEREPVVQPQEANNDQGDGTPELDSSPKTETSTRDSLPPNQPNWDGDGGEPKDEDIRGQFIDSSDRISNDPNISDFHGSPFPAANHHMPRLPFNPQVPPFMPGDHEMRMRGGSPNPFMLRGRGIPPGRDFHMHGHPHFGPDFHGYPQDRPIFPGRMPSGGEFRGPPPRMLFRPPGADIGRFRGGPMQMGLPPRLHTQRMPFSEPELQQMDEDFNDDDRDIHDYPMRNRIDAPMCDHNESSAYESPGSPVQDSIEPLMPSPGEVRQMPKAPRRSRWSNISEHDTESNQTQTTSVDHPQSITLHDSVECENLTDTDPTESLAKQETDTKTESLQANEGLELYDPLAENDS